MKKILCLLCTLFFLFYIIPVTAENNDPCRLVKMIIDGTNYGTIAAPGSFRLNWQITSDGTYESSANPIHMTATATQENTGIQFIYESTRDFVDILKGSDRSHQEGRIDMTTLTWMFRYQTASQYADRKAAEIAAANGTTAIQLYENAGDPYMLNVMQMLSDNILQSAQNNANLSRGGLRVTDGGFTYADRIYSINISGREWRISVTTSVFFMTMEATSTGFVTLHSNIRSWQSPATWIAIYPADVQVGKAFNAFKTNTTVNNNFQMANMEISRNITGVGSAVDTNSFSDYIFDMNEYVTSSGERVKISTAYDYVWQDGNQVYFSDSALDMPSGADRLYAR